MVTYQIDVDRMDPSCKKPLVPTYTAKPGRRYRYYVCKSPRQHGWNSCPTKSVPARMIERFGPRSAPNGVARDTRATECSGSPVAIVRAGSWRPRTRIGERCQL